jgi:hypothetical protein
MENPVTVLDPAYYESAVLTANRLVQDNVDYWMRTCSKYITVINNIKELLSLYKAGNIHDTLCSMVSNVPDVSSPPPVPQLLLHIPPPNGCSAFKTRTNKETLSPPDIYDIIRREYKHTEPSALSVNIVPSVPETAHNLDLQNLEEKIVKCQDMIKEVDNMTLYNAANFGHWLELAFCTYQREKDTLKSVWPSFRFWVEKRCGVSDTWAKELRNFYSLVSIYPQLLFCRLSLSFFRRNRKHILGYFSCELETALRWKHPLTCVCQCCGP